MRITRPCTSIIDIHTSALKTPDKYQRSLEKARAKRIYNKFSWDAFGVLLVKKVGDYYIVLDGQHRLVAVHMAFPEGTYVPCKVTTMAPHEAIILKNTNMKPFNKNNIFWANFDGKREREVNIVKAVEQETTIILQRGSGSGRNQANMCKCVDTLGYAYDTLGDYNFRLLLSFLQQFFSRPNGYGIEADALTDRFLRGMVKYVASNPEIRMVNRLKKNKYSAADIIKLAKSDNDVSDGNRSLAVLKVLNRI